MEFQEVVARRRMVRHFATEPLDRAVLERIGLTAQRAPSAGFSQGQRLLVVTDPERPPARRPELQRALLRRARLRPVDQRGAGALHPVRQRGDLSCPLPRAGQGRRRGRLPRALRPAGRRRRDDDDWPVPYWWMDIGCTVMLVLLAAVDEGLAAGFVSSDDIDVLRTELGIPADFVPVGVIPVGRKLPDTAFAVAQARLAARCRVPALGDMGRLSGPRPDTVLAIGAARLRPGAIDQPTTLG